VDEPKKKRRLLIIDVESDGTVGPVVAIPPTAATPAIITPGYIHGQAQKEILRLCKAARFDEEKIEDRIWIKLDEVLKSKTIDEAHAASKKALDSAHLYFLMRAKKPEKQAKAAERISKMYRNKGDDVNADKQLAKAKKFRAEMAEEAKKP